MLPARPATARLRTAWGRRALVVATVAATLTVAPMLPTTAKPAPVPTQNHVIPLTGVDARARGAADSVPVEDRMRVAALSAAIPVGDSSIVGVTWDAHEASGTEVGDVQVRTRSGGRWSAWEELHVDASHGPDEGTTEAAGARHGSAPLVVGDDVDDLQVGVVTTSGKAPRDLQVDLIDPGASRADSQPALPSAGAAGVRPTIRTRADWGADESIRKGSPNYAHIDVGFVHHTAGSNSYGTGDVPGIIRGIYTYHVKSLGWNDIGYNFLVDKWGRMWEGRAGGMDRAVVGAHTLGYNSHSFAMAAIGNYNSTAVPAAVESAYTSLFAWKLGLAHVDPTSTTTLTDADGSPTKVFRNVSGHRDFGDSGKGTECPGTVLYNRIETLRPRIKTAQGAMFYAPRVDRTSWTYGTGGAAKISATTSKALAWRLEVRSVCSGAVLTTRTGTSAATSLAATWDGRIGSAAAPPGGYTLTLTATAGSGSTSIATPWQTAVTVGDAPGAPPGYCPPRLGGASRFDVAVAASREADSGTTSVVIANGRDNAMGDALVSAPLARAKDAVLLLTDATGLPTATRTELTRRGARTAYVVGGEGSVGQVVIDQLKALGVTSVERFGGRDRYAVAANVARAAAPGGAPDVFVASGKQDAMADGLVTSGLASSLARPILLSPAATPSPATTQALTDLGVQRTTVAGGPASVSDEVMAQLPSPTRLGGASRYAVSVAVAQWGSRNGVDGSDVLASSGAPEALADALSGGQLGRQLFYVRPTGVPGEVATELDSRAGLERVTVMGGEGSVPPLVAGRLQQSVMR
ncbi:cell wall-binding repeat-containing protein [Knoellia sp. LjRoot47]|uniref:cell wall-binding repeat-containing protein n=1 Tax=Knoellia sp. LjRoot47 TaxID=3342330 RepID=UPI003ECE874D